MPKEKTVLNYELLRRLTQAFGPSGNEQEVASLIAGYCRDYADSVTKDPLGNLIVRKQGAGKKIMIAAHMDEIGVIVTHIDEDGYLYFSPVGGVRKTDLPAKRVMFSDRRIGVVAQSRSIKAADKAAGRCFIDIGVSSEEEARSVVREGDTAVLAGEFAETPGYVISKALDNRLGCFLALEALKNFALAEKQSENDFYFVFTAQEEVGARGARTAAYAIEPDLALVIDTTPSYDTPEKENRTCLNKGVAIKVMDRSILVSPKIMSWMADIAAGNDLAFQREIITAGGTDSGPIHLSKSGIPTGGLAVPVRYLHSGSEIAAKADLSSAYELLIALLNSPYEEK